MYMTFAFKISDCAAHCGYLAIVALCLYGLIESYMVSQKIIRQTEWTDGELNEPVTNKSLNGWTDGELNARLTKNLPNGWLDGEFNKWLENNSPNGWTDGE